MTSLLVAIVVILVGWYSWYFQQRARKWKDTGLLGPEYTAARPPKVSVLIAFRNEERNLQKLLNSLLVQTHTDAEYIFIDDHSSDRGPQIIAQCTDSRVTLLQLKGANGKKAAIAMAIEHARSEIVLSTDADCYMGPQWLELMCAPFENPKVQMVSGPVVFTKEATFWQRWMKLEFIGLVAMGASGIALNKPSMCNGANLAYRKRVFDRSFLHEDLSSGEDVFMMLHLHQHMHNSVVFCHQRQAMVFTEAPETLHAFIHQRIRWASKSTAYPSKRLKMEAIMLVCYHLASLVFWIAIPFQFLFLLPALLMITVKILNDRAFYKACLPFFNATHLMKNFILSELLHWIYIPFFAVVGLKGTYQWKGRKNSMK